MKVTSNWFHKHLVALLDTGSKSNRTVVVCGRTGASQHERAPEKSAGIPRCIYFSMNQNLKHLVESMPCRIQAVLKQIKVILL